MDPTSAAPNDDQSSLESLESSSNTIVNSDQAGSSPVPSSDQSSETNNQPGSQTATPSPKTKNSRFSRWWSFFRRFNIYILMFVLLLIVALVVVAVAYLQGKTKTNSNVSTQTLSASTLAQLANNNATVGSNNQILNIQSSAIFAGKVLMRDSLEVAGSITVGGANTLTGITANGNSVFDSLQVNKNLTVQGDSALQGSLSVQKSLQVNGNGTFGGTLSAVQLTTSNLQLNGDLVLNHHLSTGGAIPTLANGNALGSGGTASVGGNDTGGTISVNIGSGAIAGCFATITFTTSFRATPHIILSPVGPAAASLNYYANRSTTNFSVCSTTAAPAGSNLTFDYLVFD